MARTSFLRSSLVATGLALAMVAGILDGCGVGSGDECTPGEYECGPDGPRNCVRPTRNEPSGECCGFAIGGSDPMPAKWQATDCKGSVCVADASTKQALCAESDKPNPVCAVSNPLMLPTRCDGHYRVTCTGSYVTAREDCGACARLVARAPYNQPRTEWSSPSVLEGSTQPLQVERDSTCDFDSSDVTNLATYWSEDPKIATVDAHGIVTGVKYGNTKIHVEQGGAATYIGIFVAWRCGAGTPPPGTVLESLDGEGPVTTHVSVGGTEPAHVWGRYTGGCVTDVAASVTWTVDDESIATIDAAGIIHGVALGVTSARAKMGDLGTSQAIVVDP